MTKDLRSITSAENGAKSEGPVTPEGKATVARNAEKHGLYTPAVVLRHESQAAYDALRERYSQEFLPATQAESDLLDQLTTAAWRFRRFSALETAALDHAVIAQTHAVDSTYSTIDPETRAYLALDHLTFTNTTFTAITRAQAAQARLFERALHHLRTLQNSRNKPTFTPTK
ncbi:MAG: hypothetical protein IT162_13575 [Bryobacterales bacterium]|nr:hypothetical protein [Bryobacterales bacterium]